MDWILVAVQGLVVIGFIALGVRSGGIGPLPPVPAPFSPPKVILTEAFMAGFTPGSAGG